MLDLIREIGQTLRNNKLRTALTGISVAWGIFMLIILLGAARGVTNYFEESMGSNPTNVISIWGGRTSKPYKGYKDGRWIELKEGDAAAIVNDNPGHVSRVSPFASADTAKIKTSRDAISGFEAVFPDAIRTKKLTMKYGRFINDLDISEARRVMVLADNQATLLFGNDADALGKTVSSMGLAWTVVGIYSHRWNRSTYAPYTTYKAVTGNNDYAYQLDATVEGLTDEASGDAVEEAIRASLAAQHNFAPDDANAIWTWNRFNDYLRGQRGNNILRLAVWIIGLLTLLTGIVGVSNIMFVSVRERTHEIGIRRAIGAKPRSIVLQVITESIAVTGLFGYIGVFLGIVVLQFINHFVGDSTEGFRNPTVDLSMALQVTVALIVAGAIAGLFPAIKATKVKPVEALRDE